MKSPIQLLFVVLQISALSSLVSSADQQPQATPTTNETTGRQEPLPLAANANAVDTTSHDNREKVGLEPRATDQNFVKDIVDRLHSLDADIGRLLFNSTSMYAPTDQAIAQNEPKGSEKFTEVLNDLDSLQDEIGGLIGNATKVRQYNMVVRLRPLNSILYRIRHNLHLMRNSLVAINTVSGLEKLGNSVLDSTLQAFMRPDANLNEEIGDDGNYDINLDKPEPNTAAAAANVSAPATQDLVRLSAAPTTSSSSTTTTTTTTTPAPSSSSSSSATPSTTTTTTTQKPATSRRTTQRSSTRNRPNNHRNNRRSTTQKPANSTTTTTQAAS